MNIPFRHYVVRGPEDSPYVGGYYHGKLVFPREFPFKPPSIYMFTPNGRFKCNTRYEFTYFLAYMTKHYLYSFPNNKQLLIILPT